MMALNEKGPRPAVAGNLLGEAGPRSIIDSGYLGGGWLMPKRYAEWTNQLSTSAPGTARAPNARFFGEMYPDVAVDRADVESDGIGLDFLARHLVTLDFPKQTLYLKRTSIGSPPNVGGSPLAFLKSLKNRGQLPGWSKEEHGTPKDLKRDKAANTAEIEVVKEGEQAIYHYKLMRASADGPWRLVKSWRTDTNGRMLEAYPESKESLHAPSSAKEGQQSAAHTSPGVPVQSSSTP